MPVTARLGVATAVTVITGLLSVGVFVPAAVAADSATGTMLVAHRGSSVNAPENTLVAFDRAVAEHADRMSLDVRLTKDGVPVVIHDGTLTRTTDAKRRFPGSSPWSVGDLTLAQMRTLDAGSWFGDGVFTGIRVPTLDEVLRELGPSPTGLTVEIKTPAVYGGAARIGKAVLDVIRAHPEWASSSDQAQPRLVVESFDWSFLDDLHALDNTLPLMPLSTDDITPADLDAHPYFDELDVEWRALSPGTVAAAHARGIRVGTWTPNETSALSQMIAMGLDLVTSDQTERLAGLLASSGRTFTGTTWPTTPASRVTLTAPRTATIGTSSPVRVAALDGTGGALRWQPVTLQVSAGGVWRTVAHAATSGAADLTLRSAVPDGPLVLRAVSGTAVSATVSVRTHIAAVPAVAGLPAPAVRLAAQPRRAAAGARPVVTRVSVSAWRSMAGRSYQSGCPVSRTALRLVSSTYWGFDGYRHRGSVVVDRRAAGPLARVLTRLYDQHLPLRSMRRVEQLGGYRSAVERGLAGDAAFGFACQQMPGDRATFGSHSRGLVVSVNPWENPTSPGAPDVAWLDRHRSLPYVHRAGNAVVQAFAAGGFSWRGSRGRYGEFRYVL